ncbi:MAG: class I SAM-dependent methyltransferase [Bacteroidia bacterium]|nr:class I SAM-dependent methyltransferase [Bacteroidia bacterium]
MPNNTIFCSGISDTEKKLFIKALVDSGGPEHSDYEKFTSIINSLEQDEVDEYRKILLPVLNENTLIGYGFKKPFGYPGDFNLINSIYNHHINKDDRFRNWDIFFQNQPGAIAVRNRKEYFINYCKRLTENSDRELRILILGSGPATDVFELLENDLSCRITFDLIDFDQNAIDFSREKNRKFNGSISYNRINVLRYKPFKAYDLIWSAGLFDYFKDKHFIFLIQKYVCYLAAEGEYIISNFSTDNPTRRLMEVLSDWYLNHRDKDDLLDIASRAGIDKSLVRVDTEPLGVNLFLRIRKG